MGWELRVVGLGDPSCTLPSSVVGVSASCAQSCLFTCQQSVQPHPHMCACPCAAGPAAVLLLF
jgi:hypothetical protein